MINVKKEIFLIWFEKTLVPFQVTILDTIFSPISRTFYVLDVMIWSQMPYYGCDTEFRSSFNYFTAYKFTFALILKLSF